jgi:hypothetical protein
MLNDNTWALPFGEAAELELKTEWGQLSLQPVEPGGTPRLELTRGSGRHIQVNIDKVGESVRVSLDPQAWFGGWECRATVYVPRDVRASVHTNAGSVSVRDLVGCELAVKASAGKIDLTNVQGMLRLEADAGSVTGRDVGGYFDVETHAGSIRLDIFDVQPGEHRIRASMGSVKIELARGLDVCIETHTSMGSIKNGYLSNKSAPAKLVLSTEMGSVRVSEGNPHRQPWRTARPGRPFERTERPSEPSAAPRREDPELDRILKMVEAGDLSAQDADELLKAMGRV